MSGGASPRNRGEYEYTLRGGNLRTLNFQNIGAALPCGGPQGYEGRPGAVPSDLAAASRTSVLRRCCHANTAVPQYPHPPSILPRAGDRHAVDAPNHVAEFAGALAYQPYTGPIRTEANTKRESSVQSPRVRT